MRAREPLAVWLDGEHIATVERRREGLRLAYTEGARRRWAAGTPLVSVAMPVAVRPHGVQRTTAFFEGLLPEGEPRRTVAYDLGIEQSDTYGLLHALGRDCAGALVLQPVSAGPPRRPVLAAAEPVDDEEVARRIAALRAAPLGVDAKVRLSLAGVQRKLLLVRLGARSWGLPVGGAPSTHILKPPIAGFEGSVENEAFCMRLAKRIGLPSAPVEVAVLGSRPVLVVERFDRHVATGTVRRIHQEDACQALSVPTEQKYEERGGPSLGDVAGVLRTWRAPARDLVRLLQATTFAVVIGDADRHAKNVTLLHDPEGRVRLAPLYDVMCTSFYPEISTTLGMFVNGKRDIDMVSCEDLVAEGLSWGLDERHARDAVADVVAALPDAVRAETDESPWAPPGLCDLLGERTAAAHLSLWHTELELSGRVGVRAGDRGGVLVGDRVGVVVGDRGGVVEGDRVGVVEGDRGGVDDRIWVGPYRRADGTPVRGHWRQGM